MKVKELMHKGIETVAADTPLRTVAQKMAAADIGALPVVDHDKVIGMVTDRDITVRSFGNGADPAGLTARDVMSDRVISCRDDEDCEDAVRLMESKQIRRLPVLDAHDKPVGMLSLGDISHAMPRDISAEVLKAVSAHHA